MFKNLKIAAVIPCYRVADQILNLIRTIPPEVDRIYCVDDACPAGSGKLVMERCADPRISVLFNERNLGVGGAVKAGYVAARADDCDIAVKLDGDGQMDPRLIPAFLLPIALGQADYTKGNRFFHIEDVNAMPVSRLLGNAALTFLAKFSTGYWNVADPTNGYTAAHLGVLDLASLEKVSNGYFFETDLLFRLNIARCVVRDIPMTARYGTERSSLRIQNVLWQFLAGHIRNFVKRILYGYFLRDFNIASAQILLGVPLLAAGFAFGIYHWRLSIMTGTPATAGTVMIAALMILTGIQFCLGALNYDITSVPKEPLHPLLQKPSHEER